MSDPHHEPAAVERLDRALLAVRRGVSLPQVSGLPQPGLEHGLDAAKALACMAIADLTHGDPDRVVTVKDVAAALTLEHSTASRLLADTEAQGLLTRATDPRDRRRTSVTLTPTGTRVVAQVVATRTWALDRLLADWPDQDLVRFTELVEQFADTMQQHLSDVIVEAAAHFPAIPTQESG